MLRGLCLLSAVCFGIVSAGTCDALQSAGTPCVAAHGMTRSLCGAAYKGPLYQVKRESDRRRSIYILCLTETSPTL
ncbi:unnamed protein product [Peronospora belbahrii]|uniref:Alpha-L-arabinofuranosidase B catalytic domain-containing protein n=1 Tax=Peronospora belbahrii TaxID=622444 RepID=A0ABN8CSC5_9STRA|nr:unnamed protein product [Peronospora belbahrii]